MKKLIPALLALGAAGACLTPAPAAADIQAVGNYQVQAGVAGRDATLTAQYDVVNGATTVSCNGAGCEGLDPYANGCANDAVTRDSRNVIHDNNQIVSVVELQFSAACNASWAEIVTVNPVTQWAPYPIANAYVNSTDPRPDHSYTGPTINAGNTWTAMVASTHAQACLGRADTPPYNCTAIS